MIVITGGSGRLGQALRCQFPEAQYPVRAELDVCDASSVDQYIRLVRPKVLIHGAAMTDVRMAQTNHDLCWNTNVLGTERLVDAISKYEPDCYFVYVSTACVFQGDQGNYSEEDLPNPKNFYGLSKLIAEYVARRLQNHLIIRTNFVARQPWPFPRAFVDRFGTYLFADDVACKLRELVDQHTQGLVHITGDRKMSMFELARLTSPNIEPLTMDEVSLPLTIDMSLRSQRLAPSKIDFARARTAQQENA